MAAALAKDARYRAIGVSRLGAEYLDCAADAALTSAKEWGGAVGIGSSRSG